jgi:hypothetical protein
MFSKNSAAFRPANGMAEGSAIEIFAQVHESKESVEDARLQFVWKVQPAGCGASQ